MNVKLAQPKKKLHKSPASRPRKYSLCLAAILQLACAAAIGQTTAGTDHAESITAEESATLLKYSELGTPERATTSRERTAALIQAAKAYSPGLREAGYLIGAATEDIEAAKGAKKPQVTATTQSLFTTGDINISARATGSPGLTLSAQMPIYDWGRIDAQIRGREAVLAGTYARTDLVARQLIADTLSTCLQYAKQRALLRANLDYIEKIQKLGGMIEKIVAVDEGRASELIQVRSRLLQANSSADVLVSNVKEFQIRTERLLGPRNETLCTGLEDDHLLIPELAFLESRLATHPQLEVLRGEYDQQRSLLQQITATKKPQVIVRADNAPMAVSVNNNYQQSVALIATAPLYDGNTLRSQEKATLERVNSVTERIELTQNQLTADVKEKHRNAAANLRRASDYVGLLEINRRVRDDFFLQWAALGRRSLFELLAIEAEQFSLQSGYYTALYDALTEIAGLKANYVTLAK